ncbi:uncharacterized protein LOC123684564 [Harmonia axyridis]|uniref:uncharacterized protein LOC123684564 n=1 Tax=Harmonia axyridis TaxID=115357 RepID=UPI001E2799B1|nr:uncharacterized protein LOC123684564 [Harmonia axyridis]
MRSPSDDVPQNESCQSQSQTSYFSHSNSVNLLPANSTVLLATAQVDIQDAWGNFQKVRVLLDAGSQINIISQSCVNKLGLQISKTALSITGIGESSSTASGSTVCSIRPTGQINSSFTFDAVVLPKICTQMPTSLVQFSNWKCISNKKLADPEFSTPHSVDILLGADIFPLVLKDGRIKGNGSEPTALETVFGWVFMGRIQSPSRSMNSFHLSLCDSSLNSTLKRFWELEEVPTTTSSSPEDQRCEQLFVEGHSRDASGRYTVALPFESGKCVCFGDTYSLALRRFLSLERRLIRTPEVYQEYCHFMKDYLSSNHMSSVITDVETENNFYIPHHCIIKPDSASTKLRVVFDASAHLPGKLSLNDALLIGPKLQKDIFVILLNFRVHTFVFTADIKQMYRQILIQPSHRDYQRILWRFSPSEPIGAYRLNSVTYGVAPAPFLALRTLSQLAEDEGASFPNASKILLRDIYVDDIVTGCDDLEQAKVLVDELISLLECGGFELRLQWDDSLPVEVNNRWNQCKSELHELAKLKIPRLLASGSYSRCELHGFGDSSERGYAAVIYLRFFYPNGSVGTSFVCGKSKVSPVKRISIPRLELCACLLLSKLISLVLSIYSSAFQISKVFAWSDSTVALTWIRSSPHRWKSFVSNRTTQIQELVSPELWYHVKSRDNPADCASRGLTPVELLNCTLWWAGPYWLRSEETTFDRREMESDQNLVREEERHISLPTFVCSQFVPELLSKFSSLSKIQRIVVYVFRFVHNLKNSKSRINGIVSSMDLKHAFTFIIKQVQQSVFQADIANIQNEKPISKGLQFTIIQVPKLYNFSLLNKFGYCPLEKR